MNDASCISPDVMMQIRSLLSLTDTAILRVRQARVLECLRFQLMNERLEDVDEAHERTFDWIFDCDAVGVQRRSSRSSSASFATSDSSNSEVHDLVDSDTGSAEEPQGQQNNASLSQDESERGRARSRSPSEVMHGPTRSTGSHSATRSAELERGSTEENVLVDNAGKSGDHDSDADSSIVSYAEIEQMLPADQVSILSKGQISEVGYPPPIKPVPVSPSRAQDVPEHLWKVMEKARDDFIAWLERDHGIFHISGKPGSGKSTLMKYLYQHKRTKEHLKIWAGDKNISIGGFFFWRPGSALQKSLKGIVRGLLHCVLSEAPDLIPILFPEQWEESMFNDKLHIDHHECQQGFNLLTSMNDISRDHNFAFFVDGLDEFDGNHSDLVRQLFDWVTNSQNIKLCVSSREWAVFHDAFKDCPQFSLHHLTRSDMQRVVRDRLQQLNIDALSTSEIAQPGEPHPPLLADEIVRKSEGVFIWLSLVLRQLEEGLINGDDMQDLWKITDSLPTELEPMFQNLLDSIPRSNLKLAFALLSFASFTGKFDNYCRLMQFSFVEDYIANKDFALLAHPTRVDLLSDSENANRLGKARRRVYGVCKGFLELRQHYAGSRWRVVQISDMLGECVRLNHRSIVEFLESDYFAHRRDLILPEFNPWDAYLQTYLGVLGNVDLPGFYFAPDRRSENRGAVPLDMQLMNIKDKKCVPPYLMDDMLPHSPSPSFRGNMTDFMLLHLNLGNTMDSSRFCHFLCHVRRTICGLQINTASTRIVTFLCDDIRCNPSELVALLAAAMGLQEYLLYEQDLTPAMIERCTELCLSNFHAWRPNEASKLEPGMGCLLKTLEALYERGGSPDLEVPAAHPLFHAFLQTACIQSFAVKPSPPCLAIIAFMLYHGSNPGFAITPSRKLLKRLDSGRPLNQASAESRLLSYKLSFRSYKCAPTKELQGSGKGTVLDTRRLLAQNQLWMKLRCSICAWPTPRPSPGWTSSPVPVPSAQAQSSRHRLVVQVPEEKREALDKADHRVDLRTLVSIWFPHQAENLQKVIDRIFELGVPLNKEQRWQLKLEFGDLLRPYFDQAHPEFPGWLPGTSPRSSPDTPLQTPDGGLLSDFQFQIQHLDTEPLDKHRMQEPSADVSAAE